MPYLLFRGVGLVYSMLDGLTCEDWYDMSPEAIWRFPASRPGESPYKASGCPFEILPGASEPFRIKPDVVHTFHIGFGQDLASSAVVWIAKLGRFGRARKFDDRLCAAFSEYQMWCKEKGRYTSCEYWTSKKLGISPLDWLLS